MNANEYSERIAELERANAAAMTLLDSCLRFFDALDTNDWPAGLDMAIRHFKRQAAGEIPWDETPAQTMRRDFDNAWLAAERDALKAVQP